MGKPDRHDAPDDAPAPGRRRFLGGVVAAVAGAAFAPAIKAAASGAGGHEVPRRPSKVRWIGHC